MKTFRTFEEYKAFYSVNEKEHINGSKFYKIGVRIAQETINENNEDILMRMFNYEN